jgi:CheY-like chemotaxis protein
MNKYKYIMLIDDNEVDNLMHKKILNVTGIAENIISFLNGLEAINYFRILTEINVSPYLIFLDLNMPKMDGFKFISEYKRLPPEKRKGRIVILSSSNNLADIKRAASLGITDYIVKPLTVEKVKAITLTDAVVVPAEKK